MNTAKTLLSIILISTFSITSTLAKEPLALRKIMRDMGENMQSITDGISHEDWGKVESNAKLIADHPKPPFSEKLRILAFAGTDMPKFKKFDGITHDAASSLAQAASLKDGPAVIQVFSKLQSSCLECHQTFRKPFVQNFYTE